MKPMLLKISKAIAGGLAAAAGGAGTAYVVIPADVHAAAWVYAAVPIANFVVGFVIVYWSPANVPTIAK